MTKHITPLQAIRRFCVDCCNGQPTEVRLCPSEHCALWPYRFGKTPGTKPALGALRSIRTRCLDCSGGSRADVRDCWDKECSLHIYRMGRNPHRAGLGGNIEAVARARLTAG